MAKSLWMRNGMYNIQMSVFNEDDEKRYYGNGKDLWGIEMFSKRVM